MKRWIFLAVLSLVTACGGGNVTLDFTFQGSTSCQAAAIDSIQYTVVDGASKMDASGSVTCGQSASFSLAPGAYTVNAYAVSGGFTVNQTSSAIQVESKGDNTFIIDFSQNSI